MQEIKCPKCGEVFVVDESGYANIVKQVRDKEFAKELQKREEELKDAQQKDLDLVRLEQKNQLDKALSAKDSELSEKDKKIQELEACIKNNDISRNLAVSEARQLKDKELAEKNTEIIRLKDQLSNKDTEKQLGEESLKREYEAKLKHKDEQLKEKDEQIDYYKDFKARQSTKMVGESLEQHCLTQFNSLRMTAFPTAYFEKDNDAKSGSKGDFIFRESVEGTEFISIMFEMKNEMDETATKHKNEDFFKELDKDRREKKCEYAVLVSLLEMDNELYNNGIVDVSYRYEKMYVIRPQFFIPMITLLRNAALNSLKYRQEL